MRISIYIFYSCLLFAPVYSDSWAFPKKINVETKEYGDTKIELITDARENQGWPLFELIIYNKGKMLSKYRNVAYSDIFASKDGKYFLGVSNSGIPGTAYIIFDSEGKLIKEVKHAFSGIKYSERSVTIVREWYDLKTINVEFVCKSYGLEKVLVSTKKGEKLNLLEYVP